MIAYVAAWIFVFAVPWQNVVMIPGLGTISRLAGLVAVGITVVAVLLRGGIRRLLPFHIAALVFTGWVAVSTFWSLSNPDYAQDRAQTYLQLAVMLWVVWEAAPTRARLIGLLTAYVLGGYVAALDTIINYQAGEGTTNFRYAASGFDPNELGSLLALGIPTAWYLQAVTTNVVLRWVARCYVPVAVVAIMLTGSRGAMLAMAVAAMIVPLTFGRLKLGIRLAAVPIVIVAAIFAVRFVPEASWQRLSTTQSEIKSGTLNNRLVIWKAGLRVLPLRPIHGFGPNGFQRAVAKVLGHGEAPHNTFLAILVEEGMIGLLIYLTMLGLLFRGILALPWLERRYALVLFATLILCMLPLGWETAKPAWLTLSLLVGCADQFRLPAPRREPVGPLRAVPAIPSA